MRLEEYQDFYRNKRELTCRFNINRLGTLMFLDDSLKVIYDERLDSRGAENLIDKDINVTISKIDIDNNTIYVSRAKTLEEKIDDSISNNIPFKCKAIVKEIASNRVLYAEIPNTTLTGVLFADNWRKKTFTWDLKDVCSEGDEIDVCVINRNTAVDINADLVLSREAITTDPWEDLMDDVWVKDATLDVTCVNNPRGKTYWWGRCEQIEDIDLMGDYSSKFTVKRGGKYRCKIDECNKAKRIFKVVPFSEIFDNSFVEDMAPSEEIIDDKDNSIPNKDNGDTKKIEEPNEIRYDLNTVNEIVEDIVSHRSDVVNRGGYIRKCVISHIENKIIPDSLVESILYTLLKNSQVDLAYKVFKVFRPSILSNERTLVNFLNYATGIAKKQEGGDGSLLDALYTEYYVFLKKNKKNPEDSSYIGLFNSAVNYYINTRKYNILLLFYKLRADITDKNDPRYAVNFAEYYLYRGYSEKALGEYYTAVTDFHNCVSYAKKMSDKATKEKYTRVSFAEMNKCKETQKQYPVDKYFDKLDYEGAYKYFLGIHTKNPENETITALFNRIEGIYDRSVTRVGSLPSIEKKGISFRKATAAETIEENLPKAETLWKKSIDFKEPGKLAAIKSYVSILIREKKYILALEACRQYLSAYKDTLEQFAIQIKIYEIFYLLGQYDEAIKEASKIESRYKSNSEFVTGGGLPRLALLLSKVAGLQSNELGLYKDANNTLNKALKCGLERSIYASAYINNCMSLGDYKSVSRILKEFSDVLSDEYVYSVKTSLKNNADIQLGDGFALLDTYSSKGNERFFDWFVSKNIVNCPEDIKEYTELDELKTPEEITNYIKQYPEYDSNLNAQVYLNAFAANHIYENIDGYASKAYYTFVAQSIVSENRIRINRRRNNIYLAKYASIALFDTGDVEASVSILIEALNSISQVNDRNTQRIYTSILMSNSPLLKLDSSEVSPKYVQAVVGIASSKTYDEALSIINGWINSYNDQNKAFLETKTDLLNCFENDSPKAEQILVGMLENAKQLLEDDKRHIERLIDINRRLIQVSKTPDYYGKNIGLEETRNKIIDTRHTIEDSVTPFSLLLWIDVLQRLDKIVEDEQAKINVTLSPRITISVDNGAVFSTNGKISLNYSLSNENNCAPAKDIRIEFEDGDGNPLAESSVNGLFNLSGGESKSLIQMFDKDSSFSLNIRVSYIDVSGNETEISSSESIIVNQAKSFAEISNPFTTAASFDPNDSSRVFVGRERLINDLKQQLMDSSINCAVLYGQKRTGKTSIFKRLEKLLADEFIACRVSMNSVSTMERFYKAVAHSFKKEAPNDDIKSQLSNLDVPTDRFEFEEYIQDVSDIYGKRVLLLLDEFSHLYDLRKTSFPEEFMNEWKELMEYNLFSAIITGQETLADLINIYANQFAVQYTVPVEYISYEFFHDMVDKPILTSEGQSRYKEKSFDKLWQLTKGHPYLTQSFCDKMVKYLNTNKTEYIFDATIDKVTDNYIQEANEKDFDSFYCRYSKNDGEYADEVNSTISFLIKLTEECGITGNGVCDISRLGLSAEEDAIKTSLVRRGVIDIDENNRCEIRVKLFYEWLRRKGKNIFSLQNVYEFGKTEQRIIDDTQHETIPQIINNNNYYGDMNQISGDYIQHQVNNIDISIENAVMGLEKLQSLVSTGMSEHNAIEAKAEIAQLPFNSDAWEQLSEEEIEEKTAEYADKIFNSSSFINKELTDDQKHRFHLSQQILDLMSPDCQTQIICGIQVYDLIQYCIDNYGLEMNVSESPRGILFARAFEKHMKDCMYDLLGKTEGFKDQTLPSKKTLAETPINKTTIGNYSYILQHGDLKIIEDLSVSRLGKHEYNVQWWDSKVKILNKIGKLRNDCCHSGSKFAFEQLSALIKMIFEDDMIKSVHVIKELEESKQSLSNTNKTSVFQGNSLDPSIIGSIVDFEMMEKTTRKSVRGLIMGRYPASLSPIETSKVGYQKGKVVKTIVNGISDEKYVLAIPGS